MDAAGLSGVASSDVGCGRCQQGSAIVKFSPMLRWSLHIIRCSGRCSIVTSTAGGDISVWYYKQAANCFFSVWSLGGRAFVQSQTRNKRLYSPAVVPFGPMKCIVARRVQLVSCPVLFLVSCFRHMGITVV